MFADNFSGTGVIPEGWTLVVFDRSLVNPNAWYWYNKPAEPTRTGWVARRVQIGDGEDAGKRVEISAVLLPEDFSAYLPPSTPRRSGGQPGCRPRPPPPWWLSATTTVSPADDGLHA